MDHVAQSDSAGLTPDQALGLLGKVISRAAFYNAINRGEVPHRRLGKRIIIPRHAFLEWLESAPTMRGPVA
jgi:predicted DNA-binding transcriptional regulator AlpA